MKKILAVSLVAIMAAGAARADIASTTYVKNKTGNLTALTTTNNANLVEAINEINLEADTLRTDLGSKGEDGKYTGGLGKEVADVAAVASQALGVANEASELSKNVSDLEDEVFGTLEGEDRTGGLVNKVDAIEEKLKSVATTQGLGELTSKVEANETAIGSFNAETGEGSGLAKSVVDNATAAAAAADAAAAAQGTADDAMAAIGGTKADGTKTGLVKDIAAAAEAAAAAQANADTNAKNIGDMTNFIENYGENVTLADRLWQMSGDLSGVADGVASAQGAAEAAQGTANANAGNIGNVNDLTTTAKTLVPAINEVKGIADGAASAAAGAKSAADAAQGTADSAIDLIGGSVEEIENATGGYSSLVSGIGSINGRVSEAQETADQAKYYAQRNATAIATYDELGNLTGGLTKDIADAAAAAAGAKSAADAAQATADLKVNKSALGINDTAENPFEVPDWCKGTGVVCSFVVLDGVAGWQKVVDEDPAA